MRILTIDPSRDAAAVDDIIKIYQAAFGGTPWNEGWKCVTCKHVMPLHPAPIHCTACGGRTEQYWPYAKVLADFKQEMGRQNAQCIVATVQRKIVGFAWGYDISFMLPNDEKSLEEKLDASGLCHELSRYDASCLYFYLDDIAVHSEHQGDGIGKQLINSIVQGHRQVLLRTLKKSHMYNLVTNIGGKSVLDISHERVIMRILPPPAVHSRVDRGGGAISSPHRGDGSPMSDPGFGRIRDAGH